ncbi:hypothetical protein BDN70DRAFT_918632 [Pholiota conissans]|uniref:Uncharacterized protein n=1 Tax=Pholiota conissans TaxID=109636 RepID=A0A9P6D4I2_9AGAR|nr:hypothetical protein BDN70DRAFT_918632 [Pholiota conissans]
MPWIGYVPSCQIRTREEHIMRRSMSLLPHGTPSQRIPSAAMPTTTPPQAMQTARKIPKKLKHIDPQHFANSIGRLPPTASPSKHAAFLPTTQVSVQCQEERGAPLLPTTREHPQPRGIEDTSGYGIDRSDSNVNRVHFSPAELSCHSEPLMPQGHIHGADIVTQYSPENIPSFEEPLRDGAIHPNIAGDPIPEYAIYDDDLYERPFIPNGIQIQHPVPINMPQHRSFNAIAPNGILQNVAIDRNTQTAAEYPTPHNDHSSPCTVPMYYNEYDAATFQQGGFPVFSVPYDLDPPAVLSFGPETWDYSMQE